MGWRSSARTFNLRPSRPNNRRPIRLASPARDNAPGGSGGLHEARLEDALALVRSADRAVRDQRISDARLLYARALRLMRAAGHREAAMGARRLVNRVISLAAIR